MIICFTLSMPGRNSWNGKWSGDARGNFLFKTVSNTIKNKNKVNKLIANGPYSYNFGDGWCASISLEVITEAERRKRQKINSGFSGYNWMVTSIWFDGEIYGPTNPKPKLETSPS